MAYQYQKHYTREEARKLLPELRLWLKRISQLRTDLEKYEKRLSGLMSPGCDVGGGSVNAWVRVLADLEGVLGEFQQREIQVKDLDRGLLDFPAILGGKEGFL